MGRRQAAQGTQAIDRAAQLLTLILESEEPLGIGDLAEAAELPKSTASRLVSSLERHGLVRRTSARGKVQPGPAILRFAHRGAVDRNLAELAQESLQTLAEAGGETVNLAVPGARGVEHLAQIESRHFLGTGQWVGRTVDFHTTAVGKVLVAHGAAELPGGRLRRVAPGTIVDRELLRRELEQVREDGFATAADELEPGLTALAAPVHGPTGDVIAALSISGPTLRLSPKRVAELRPMLIQEAAALSARLGHREEGEKAA
ncbi:MAG: IclR family transcriptional regulator, acetate operon repressor [Solirubrobacteraceae bacterium]|nr:IclR family transcriptional regulator, acetate operon repressor [Solirubrobacteraceae bacterium]